MASVFTYDPDPPRISSPWPRNGPAPAPFEGPAASATGERATVGSALSAPASVGGLPVPQPSTVADLGVTRLVPEPQDGPTEYKVHLLLRPRRVLAACSTGRHVSGSHMSRLAAAAAQKPEKATAGRPAPGASNSKGQAPAPAVSPLPVPSAQARTSRLEHLTTQLLWRLQQSSPFHSSSTAKLVPPTLPEFSSLSSSPLSVPVPGHVPLLPGVAESRGALYEIGIADDGALVGLATDEMDESVQNLRAMAASLGCRVEIRRLVFVGDCQWHESTATAKENILRSGPLWVVEALVLPATSSPAVNPLISQLAIDAPFSAIRPVHENGDDEEGTEQLRVALTGATASGKSSLLGTISTSTLDNGRGRSRHDVLKHRHEIHSGKTSSIAPELVGYQSVNTLDSTEQQDTVVNYGLGNVSSWNDIHHEAAGGRLVFLTDAAGHPRYKRTLIRSLASWRPHWAAVCLAADSCNADLALSKAHLALCLRLGLPVFVVVTKTDAAATTLKAHLADVLAQLRAAGRHPLLLSPGKKRFATSEDLQAINSADLADVRTRLSQVERQLNHVVPMVLTSAVTGSGIGQLHALLRELPFLSSNEPAATSRFQIDEVFIKPDPKPSDDAPDRANVIVSGMLRSGRLSVGDTISLGPFQPDEASSTNRLPRAHSYPSRLHMRPSSHRLTPDDPRRRSGELFADDLTDERSFSTSSEWRDAQVLSVHNLRLPLRSLRADQVGTVGIVLENPSDATKLRKGMILVQRYGDGPLEDENVGTELRARFASSDYRVMAPGSLCHVFVGSVRAMAKICTVEAVADHDWENQNDALFSLDNAGEESLQQVGQSTKTVGGDEGGQIEVAFRFVHCREWAERGAPVLVTPGNAVEGSVDGLDVFVGWVTGIEA